MKILASISIIVIFSLCISETPETPPETTLSPTTAPPTTTPPAKEDLSDYPNLTPDIIKVIQNYDDNAVLNEEEKQYAEDLNKDPSLFEYANKITPENLKNLGLYWDVYNEDSFIAANKDYFFLHPNRFHEGTFIRTYDKDFSISNLIELDRATDDQTASKLLSEIKNSEHKETVLGYLVSDSKINDKDFFVADEINHPLLKAVLADNQVKNYEDDLVSRLSTNGQIGKFNTEPEEKLAIYKLLYDEKTSSVLITQEGKEAGEKIFYTMVYDDLFETKDGKYLISIRTLPGDPPAAFYLPGDIIRITRDGTQVKFLDLLEDTKEMRDKYYPYWPENAECNAGGNHDDQWTDYLNALKNGTWCIKEWSFPWEETWFNATIINKNDTVEANWGCILTPRIEIHLNELEDSKYYDAFWIGIPKKDPALIDLFWYFTPHTGPKEEAHIYIYDDFPDSYGRFAWDDTIGLRDDGLISAAMGFNPNISKDVVTRKAMTAHYFTQNFDKWMKTLDYFLDAFD